jgi:3'-5' exoribonuclease
VAGAFFHDLGKIRELSYDRQTEYTDEGRLVGHLVMTAQWIHDKARRIGVPRDLETHVVHLVLSHHGRLEYGSPKQPMTLEALITHEIDELDSRVNSWLNLMGREGGTRRWTDSNNVYEHHIWRGTLPTAQVEKKGPGPELMTPVIYVPREMGGQSRGGGGGGAAAQQRRKQRQPSHERRAEAHHVEAAAAAAPQAAGSAPAEPTSAPAQPRPDRPERAERPDRPPGRGAERHGGGADRGGFRGGPGDRKRGYTGPRLPGDKGPQPRPRTPPSGGALTHNPFAALAQKIEGGGEPGAPADAAAPAESPPPAGEPASATPAQAEAPTSGEVSTAPETTATPGVSETPAPGEVPAEGHGQ